VVHLNFFDRVENLGKKMKWYDFSLLKGTVFFATLCLITAWPTFKDLIFLVDWYWYLILFIVFSAPLFKKMYS
jgi:hypothetical protein